MPYIKQEERLRLLKSLLFQNDELLPQNAGELNYFISAILHNYLQDKGLRYAYLNEIVGVLECAKLELYRQIVAPYEREKHKLNGSVSELDKDGQ